MACDGRAAVRMRNTTQDITKNSLRCATVNRIQCVAPLFLRLACLSDSVKLIFDIGAPECRAQIVEMIGSGSGRFAKRSATMDTFVDFPEVCVDSVVATSELPDGLRAEPQASPRWPGHRTWPKSSRSRSGYRRVAERLASRRRVANSASHESVVSRLFLHESSLRLRYLSKSDCRRLVKGSVWNY